MDSVLNSLSSAFSPTGAGGLSSADAPTSGTGAVSFGDSIIGSKNQYSLVKILAIGAFTLLAIKLIKK